MCMSIITWFRKVSLSSCHPLVLFVKKVLRGSLSLSPSTCSLSLLLLILFSFASSPPPPSPPPPTSFLLLLLLHLLYLLLFSFLLLYLLPSPPSPLPPPSFSPKSPPLLLTSLSSAPGAAPDIGRQEIGDILHTDTAVGPHIRWCSCQLTACTLLRASLPIPSSRSLSRSVRRTLERPVSLSVHSTGVYAKDY